ncbi:MAG: hypothetical protein F4138_06990 [Acidimicrobiia bacterium]|nr:hypothetical protein [Acidimicrobiia bacterium]MYC57731.1 hypothetical protein [Acidimicrobiia bacterium]MYG94712.1 hypothetical protein [Acidimicrobiia bacterium]MYI29754.1 hypothetical protein [Acidimicrobiia bacterium]
MKNASNADTHLIVTFGHLLVQIEEEEAEAEAEIAKLATLCAKLSQFAATTDIIAVDTHSSDRPTLFNSAATKLIEELPEYSDQDRWRHIKIHDSILWPGSRALIRNWD